MAIDINVPSQIKNYANLAAFPATGTLKTIFIAEDTNKTYRWTGSVYVEVSASASGITIGTTAITSGVVGRVLFEGSGNVVQQSANLFWDNVNGRLGIGTSSPLGGIHLQQNVNYPTLIVGRTATRYAQLTWDDPLGEGLFQTFNRAFPFVFDASLIRFMSNGLERMRIAPTGNVLINTTTDDGFRLDVNGTARVLGNVDFGNTSSIASLLTVSIPFSVSAATEILRLRSLASRTSIVFGPGSGQICSLGGLNLGNSYFESGLFFSTGSNGVLTEVMRLTNTRNVLIKTTIDAGFTLDVNGTARVQGNSCFATTSGNVGIGTTDTSTPFATAKGLVINGGAANDVQLRLQNNAVGATQTDGGLLSISNTLMYLWNYEAGPLILGAGNAERMRIFSTGNIGINTTTDAGFRLDVNGTARVTNFRVDNLNIVDSGQIYTSSGAMALQSFAGNGNNRSVLINMNPNTTSISNVAILAANSTTKGFLPPRMTTTQKNAIASPIAGLMVYDTTLTRPCFYDGTTWITL